MSYAFDKLMEVWRRRIRPGIADARLAHRFEVLFECMHTANHMVNLPPSGKGDGVNQHSRVYHAANMLEEYDKELGDSGDVMTRQVIAEDAQKVALELSGYQVKGLLLTLGKEIKRRRQRLDKKRREGRTFVPKPGCRNMEVASLEKFEGVDQAIRAQVEFDLNEQRQIENLIEGPRPPKDGK